MPENMSGMPVSSFLSLLSAAIMPRFSELPSEFDCNPDYAFGL
jgi:hypothetical protein